VLNRGRVQHTEFANYGDLLFNRYRIEDEQRCGVNGRYLGETGFIMLRYDGAWQGDHQVIVCRIVHSGKGVPECRDVISAALSARLA
jgi:hypothetical protein